MPEVSYIFGGENNVDDALNVGSPVPNSRKLTFTEMSRMINLDPDNYNGCTLRPGQSSTVYTGTPHSGWSNGAEAYFVEGSNLKRYWSANTTTVIRTGLTPGLRMSFCQINNVIRYSNGIEQGIIELGVDTVPFVPTDPYKLPMVAGEFLEFFNGRLYALKNLPDIPGQSALYYSDSLNTPGWTESMHEDSCILFGYKGLAKMVQRVDDGNGNGGLFVSAGDETFYHSGDDPVVGGFDQRRIAPYGAIPYTNVQVKAELLGIDGLSGNACMWVSDRYVCIGGVGGFFRTIDKLAFKAGKKGAALLREQGGTTHFLFTLQDLATDEFNAYTPRTIDVETITV